MGWYVYLLRCGDGSLYTGVAKDVEARLAQHQANKGARYTRGRGPLSLLESVGPMPHGDALRLELAVKAQPREKKHSYLCAHAQNPALISGYPPRRVGPSAPQIGETLKTALRFCAVSCMLWVAGAAYAEEPTQEEEQKALEKDMWEASDHIDEAKGEDTSSGKAEAPAEAQPATPAAPAQSAPPPAPATVAGGYGMAGCGLGSLVIKENSVAQVVAATINGWTGTQTFGISTGTMNCTKQGVVLTDKEQEAFVEANIQSLQEDMVAGEGEYLSALIDQFHCQAKAKPIARQLAQTHFEAIFLTANTTPRQALYGYKRVLAEDPVVANACQL